MWLVDMLSANRNNELETNRDFVLTQTENLQVHPQDGLNLGEECG